MQRREMIGLNPQWGGRGNPCPVSRRNRCSGAVCAAPKARQRCKSRPTHPRHPAYANRTIGKIVRSRKISPGNPQKTKADGGEDPCQPTPRSAPTHGAKHRNFDRFYRTENVKTETWPMMQNNGSGGWINIIVLHYPGSSHNIR